MSDVLGKVFGIVLAFILVVITPISINAVSEDAIAKRAIVNDMTNFIDEVSDTGTVTREMLADLQTACNSHGPIIQVKVSRKVKTISPIPNTANVGTDGKVTHDTYVSYVYSDDIEKFSSGDLVTVTVKNVGYTGAQQIVMKTLGAFSPDFEVTFSAKVR